MSINPEVKVGHIHLTVSDLDKALSFYRDLLGFEVTSRYGDSAVFLSAGDYHHHIGLNTWSGVGASQPAPNTTGLYHVAFLYPSRRELALIVKKLIDQKYPITGAADHGVSEAIYLNDPDGNGVELYADRAKSEWKVNNDGEVEMITAPIDLKDLLKEI